MVKSSKLNEIDQSLLRMVKSKQEAKYKKAAANKRWKDKQGKEAIALRNKAYHDSLTDKQKAKLAAYMNNGGRNKAQRRAQKKMRDTD